LWSLESFERWLEQAHAAVIPSSIAVMMAACI
jgi:hypothetical protein